MSKDISIYDAIDDIRKQYTVVLTTLSAETARANKAEDMLHDYAELTKTNEQIIAVQKETIVLLQQQLSFTEEGYQKVLLMVNTVGSDLESYMRTQ